MTPDIGYYIEQFPLATFAHTLPGSFFACLPTGLVMLLIFYLFCRPICYALPSPHRQTLTPLCPSFPVGLVSWLVILCSLLLGAWTHNFWDAFTHEHGWFVDRIPWLQQPVVQIRSTTIYAFLVMQELSTIVGFGVMVLAYLNWLRRHRASAATPAESDRWRYLFWLSILGLAFLIAFPIAVHFATAAALRDVLFVRSIVFRTAVYSSEIAIPLALLGAGVVYTRRGR